MPNKNGMGPEGKGPKTGRGLGKCGGNGENTGGRRLNKGKGLGLRRNARTIDNQEN